MIGGVHRHYSVPYGINAFDEIVPAAQRIKPSVTHPNERASTQTWGQCVGQKPVPHHNLFWIIHAVSLFIPRLFCPHCARHRIRSTTPSRLSANRPSLCYVLRPRTTRARSPWRRRRADA